MIGLKASQILSSRTETDLSLLAPDLGSFVGLCNRILKYSSLPSLFSREDTGSDLIRQVWKQLVLALLLGSEPCLSSSKLQPPCF